MHRPGTAAEAAAAVAELAARGSAIRPEGAGTRAGWGGADPPGVAPVSTLGLDRVVAHNAGDFTAVLEAGVRLADAQRAFAGAGQWLALDPPDDRGTVGGLVATADSGPARHRYGGVRDLVIGITVALADGTLARSGGTVIKNVAGYDLGKLFTGSYGTLGLVTEVAVRLHPLPARTATVVGETDDPARLGALVLALARRPLEATSLDAAWRAGAGRVLLRFGGVTAAARAREAAALFAGVRVTQVPDDEPLWAAQRAGQRNPDGAVVKVSARPTDLPAVVAAADAVGAAMVSRAALGVCWLSLDGDDLEQRVAKLRAAVAPRPCAVLDGGHRVGDPWPEPSAGALALMRRVKERFDPTGAFRPGAYVGGI
jgi:glycolate dehydrogenase FAD-binding subunit